jgi:hypothetical protein
MTSVLIHDLVNEQNRIFFFWTSLIQIMKVIKNINCPLFLGNMDSIGHP